MSRERFPKIIREIRKSLRLSQAEFGSRIGLSGITVSRYERGDIVPSVEVLTEIQKIFNVNPDWLIMGEGEIFKKKDIELLEDGEKTYKYKYKEEDFVLVPLMSGKISAGGGLIPDNTIQVQLAFRHDWIKRHGDPKRMSLIRVSGDSMEPTLFSGDIVLVDHNRNYIDPQGGIYAIVIDDMVMIKRLQPNHISKKILVISDNNKYRAIEANPDELIIQGKIIWFGREIER
jgi:phage repressor protein C with HTH and peptisase S24 domain